MSEPTGSSAFRRELTELVSEHLDETDSQTISESLARASSVVDGADAPAELSSAPDVADSAGAPDTPADGFERELSDLLENHDLEAAPDLADVLQEFARRIGDTSAEAHVEWAEDGGLERVRLTLHTPTEIEERVERLLEIWGLNLPLEETLPMLEDVLVAFDTPGSRRPIELRARVVGNLSSSVALQVYPPDEATVRRLERLPRFAKLASHSRTRRRETTHSGLEPLEAPRPAGDTTKEPQDAPPSPAESAEAPAEAPRPSGGRLSGRVQDELSRLYSRANAETWFEVLGLHWSAHGDQIDEAAEALRARLRDLPDAPLNREDRQRVAFVRQQLERAETHLATRQKRRSYRATIVDPAEHRTALRILENKLESLSLRSGHPELEDTCRSVLDLAPDHELARELLDEL